MLLEIQRTIIAVLFANDKSEKKYFTYFEVDNEDEYENN